MRQISVSTQNLWNRIMSRILIAFTILASIVFSQATVAFGMEETFLVLQTDSGGFVQLDYTSTIEEEQTGINQYEGTNTQCSQNRDNSKKLQCTLIEGIQVNRIYEEHPQPPDALIAMGHQLYTDFVDDRLRSSVGELNWIYVCITGCPKGRTPIAIWITCGECGMEEWECDKRQESRPKLARIVTTKGVDLRAEPVLKSRYVGKLYFTQAIHVLEVWPACSEVETEEGLYVGRWIKVETSDISQKMEGWIFDIHVRYDGEE